MYSFFEYIALFIISDEPHTLIMSPLSENYKGVILVMIGKTS